MHLDYHGSINIDAGILEAVLMLPLEFAYIWNATTGERGSGGCRLNGAASRSCQPGDVVFVASSRRVESSALARRAPARQPRRTSTARSS